jgi:hypothetical protein
MTQDATAPLTIDAVMVRRFALDEEIALIQGRHKAELAPLQEELDLCERFIKDEMLKGGLQQVKLATGEQTYFSTKDSATVENWEATLAEIREKGLWHMLNKNVNKTAVKEYIEVNKVPPAGVKYDSYRDLNWRRGKATIKENP